MIFVSTIMVDPTTIVSLGRPVPHFSGVDDGISCRARSGVGKKIAVTSSSCFLYLPIDLRSQVAGRDWRGPCLKFTALRIIEVDEPLRPEDTRSVMPVCFVVRLAEPDILLYDFVNKGDHLDYHVALSTVAE